MFELRGIYQKETAEENNETTQTTVQENEKKLKKIPAEFLQLFSVAEKIENVRDIYILLAFG